MTLKYILQPLLFNDGLFGKDSIFMSIKHTGKKYKR